MKTRKIQRDDPRVTGTCPGFPKMLQNSVIYNNKLFCETDLFPDTNLFLLKMNMSYFIVFNYNHLKLLIYVRILNEKRNRLYTKYLIYATNT